MQMEHFWIWLVVTLLLFGIGMSDETPGYRRSIDSLTWILLILFWPVGGIVLMGYYIGMLVKTGQRV